MAATATTISPSEATMSTTNVTDAELAEIDRAACAGTVAAQHPSALLAFRLARDLATLRGLEIGRASCRERVSSPV